MAADWKEAFSTLGWSVPACLTLLPALLLELSLPVRYFVLVREATLSLTELEGNILDFKETKPITEFD